VDTNIILDFLPERESFLHDAEALFQGIASGQLIGYATATTLTDIFYISTPSQSAPSPRSWIGTTHPDERMMRMGN
jgi:predicted nucleic acid-binding protein